MAFEEAGDGIRSPSPLDALEEELNPPERKSWPEETRECVIGRDDFWELPKMPIGSVITFSLPSGKPEEPEALVAVLILTVASDEHGWSYGAKFMGSTEEWAKATYGNLLNRQKKKVHICQTAPRDCTAEAAIHLSHFTFWAPGRFNGSYVEKRVMKDMEKFLQAQAQKKEEGKAKAAEAMPPREHPGALGRPDPDTTGPERLAQLRSRLVGQEAWAFSICPLPGPADLCEAPSGNLKETSQRSGGAGNSCHQLWRRIRARTNGRSSKEEEKEGNRRRSPCSGGAGKERGRTSLPEFSSEGGKGRAQEEEERQEVLEEEKEEEEQRAVFILRVRIRVHLKRSPTPSAEESSTQARLHSQDVDGACHEELVRRITARSWKLRNGCIRGEFTSPGAVLLPDPSEGSPWPTAARREGTPHAGYRCGCLARWGPGASCGSTGGQVPSRGNCGIGGQLGHGKVVGSEPTYRERSCQHQPTPGSQEAPANGGACFRSGFLPIFRALLGLELRCWKLGARWRKFRPTLKRKRREQKQERKRQRRKRKERSRCLEADLVEARNPKRRRTRQGSEKGGCQELEDEWTFPPCPPSGVLEMTDDLIAAALNSANLETGRKPAASAATALRSPEMGVDLEPQASVVRGPGQTEPLRATVEGQWSSRVYSCTDLSHFGLLLAWGMANGFYLKGMSFLEKFAKPFATEVANAKYRGLFPLPVNLSFLKDLAWPLSSFPRHLCDLAWLQLIALALNQLNGDTPPYPAERRASCVKKSLEVLHGRVERFFNSPCNSDVGPEEIWDDLKNKTLNYSGEEVAVAKPLTFEQVFPSMPPEGHGGSVELLPLLEGRSRFLLSHPEEVLLPEDEVPPGKCTAKVHLEKGSERDFFLLLKQRGIITFVPEAEVYRGPNGKYLSGMFGVPKPGKVTASGRPVLRLIMNLIPINRAMGVILGDISQLPSASVWQQLVLTDGDSMTVSQADMSSAFYLFRLPPVWSRYLCFNHAFEASDVGEAGSGKVYPSCAVLPMGWSSSVGIMQMASRELLRRAHLHHGHELRKRALVPRWFLRLAKSVPEGGSWWQVYLDNFMAASVVRKGGTTTAEDENLHRLAVESWDRHGVLCSAEKHVFSSPVAVELGVELNSPNGLIGC